MDELHFLESYPFRSAEPLLLDVGAHHGYFSLTFAKKGWRVIAFEPERNNRGKFAANLRAFRRVLCVPKAVSDVSGEKVPFYVSEEHYGIHSLRPWHSTHKAAYHVETIRLDDVLQTHHVKDVTFVKIDIEGADFLALQGIDIGRYRPELVMTEFMDERTRTTFGYTHHDVASYMVNRGYRPFVSEWTPVREYARENAPSATPTTEWIQCSAYPLDHEPAWGNLLFVPDADAEKFVEAINAGIERQRARSRLVKFAKRVPGVHSSYRLIKAAVDSLRR